ncbi:methyltransferase family protein [Thermodesulfobacteriota bacterium]
MTWGLIKAIIILPGTVLVFIPSVILIASRGTRFSPDLQYPSEVTFWLALSIASAGGFLAVRTVTLFMKLGNGTPAPWEPPKKLVVAGPYRYVRNPMITGAILILLGETVLFNSWPLFLWMAFFWVANMIYFPLVEEKGLKQRFGESYVEYMRHVPRWIPRFKAWR